MDPRCQKIIDHIGQNLLGKTHQVKLALTCLFSQGHLLIEDLPGMGKTTLAHALANATGLSYNRIQFTADMLPSDVLGGSIYDRENNRFDFHPGPVFTQLLLADEINRTSPKTQSALLEAMEEQQVTIDGHTRELPQPFFVIATQNPLTQSGTYPLPESQLDRFLMRISLGYPDPEAERKLFLGLNPREALKHLKPILSADLLQKFQQVAQKTKTSDSVIAYLQRLVEYTRTQGDFHYGLSPRGALALLRSAKTWAFIHGRDHLLPDDIQAVMPAVVAHRVSHVSDPSDSAGELLVKQTLADVDVLV